MKNPVGVVLFIVSVLLASLQVRAQSVKTIAGNGTSGYNGDGGSAISSELNHPDVVKFDNLGNLYIADEHNHVIRKVSTTGIITTVAGTGVAGYTGDGGQATNAKLSRPGAVAFDASGNLYIGESGNSVIRKVNALGIISTIAGNHISGYNGDNGPATAAKISDPLGLVFDGAGNLYFSNDGYYAVRKINTAGIISTVAGTGTAGYNGDNILATNAQVGLTGCLAIGPLGELYIPDYGNFRVRKIDAAGIISTVAGNGAIVSSGDGGAATAASLLYPLSVIFDPGGNMYISDGNVAVIRKVNTAGIISTIAGIGTEGYGGDNGPATAAEFNIDVNCSAIDASGNLYIADPNNNRIRRITYNATEVNAVKETTLSLSIYPNPAHNKITVSAGEKIESVEIINLIGQVLASPEPSPKERELSINVADLPNGIYFVKVNGVCGGRFVKE